MNRRDFFKAASVSGVAVTAGCSDQNTSRNSDEGNSDKKGAVGTGTPEEEKEDPEAEATRNEHSDYYVDPNGSDSGNGDIDDPLGSIQEALHRAEPGETIDVNSGEYWETNSAGNPLQTVRDGEPGSPITITGPADAILRPGIEIKHSHIRLTGLTIEALIDAENRGDPESYFDYPVLIRPPSDSNEYLEDIVCAPEGVGYSAYALIRVIRTKDIEIGPLRVTGLAGARWILPNKQNKHAGEIVYLGSPPTLVYEWHGPDVEYAWQGEIDETRNVHIHHINNSAGHPHSEMVDAKLGTRDVTVEYCTDGGGSQNTERYPPSSIALSSYRATVRWCKLRDGEGDGILVSSGGRHIINEADDPVVSTDQIGTQLEIYGNSVSEFGNSDVMFKTGHPDSDHQKFDLVTPDDLELFCGNELNKVLTRRIDHSSPERVKSSPDQRCPVSTPEGDGIGHTGGDSPWA